MKGLFKILSCLVLISAIVCGIFFGRLFFIGKELKEDLQELESYNFELLYHVSGDSDVFNMEQYETEETPAVTQWFASYIKKMEQGGKVSGQMRDDVYHAEVFAEGEEQSSIEFYYDEQAIFGTKKTMNYIISSVASSTRLPVSVLQVATPDSYITLEQINTILGNNAVDENNHEASKLDFVKLGGSLIRELKLILPSEIKDNYFQEQLQDVDISYCMAKTKINGEDVTLHVGISNETYHKYVYVRIGDVCGKEGSNLEMLLHINVTENQKIVVPETISDDIIKTLASVIAFLNNFGK